MPEFIVTLTQTASCTITVTAEDYEKAMDAAWDQAPAQLCHSCTGSSEKPGVELAGDWEASQVSDPEGTILWENFYEEGKSRGEAATLGAVEGSGATS